MEIVLSMIRCKFEKLWKMDHTGEQSVLYFSIIENCGKQLHSYKNVNTKALLLTQQSLLLSKQCKKI